MRVFSAAADCERMRNSVHVVIFISQLTGKKMDAMTRVVHLDNRKIHYI